MESQFWKRKLLPVWYQQHNPWGELRNVRASAASLQDVQPSPTWESAAEAVVSKQTPENVHGNGELIHELLLYKDRNCIKYKLKKRILFNIPKS